MEPKQQTPTPAANDNLAADHMKVIVSEYALPERYESLVNGPWRLVGQTIIQQFGEESDAWSRMTWFTRILCTAIESSLKRNTPETVNDALNGFSIWLNSLRDEGESYSMCVSAANYAQRRISTQITEDTQEAHAVSDEECVLPGADALEIEDMLEDAAAPHLEDSPEPVTIAESDERITTADTDTETDLAQEPLESLSLSLAYSASNSQKDQPTTPEQPELPEQTERDIDMETQPQVAAAEDQPDHFDTSEPAATTLSIGSRLTDAASLAPVPMGTWLAFHDQDMPTLARLAMYDKADDVFMLGNKSGIVVRKISKTELLELIDSGMAQMVEFRAITQ